MTSYFKISNCLALFWNRDGASNSVSTSEEDGEALKSWSPAARRSKHI